MNDFISELKDKRPKYTTKVRADDLVVTLEDWYHVSLNEKMIQEAKRFDAYDSLIELIDVKMNENIDNHNNGTN